MSTIFIINGHQPYPFAKGQLNTTLTERAKSYLVDGGHRVRLTEIAKGYDVDKEIDNHQWADVIIMQFPVNWMGVPWVFKKYMDEVYTAGMDGRLTDGDGRNLKDPKQNYGTGGKLVGTKYMLSVTFNAPREAFDDPNQFLFEGGSVDDLMVPVHFNAKFLGMTPMPTFAAFDVMKNPAIEADFTRFNAHLKRLFPAVVEVPA